MDINDIPVPKKKRKQTCSLCGPTSNHIFRVPRDETRRSKWIDFCKAASSDKSSDNRSTNKSSSCKVDSIRLCILHFTESCINRNKYGIPVSATSTAVPSIHMPDEIDGLASRESESNLAMSMKNSFKRIMLKNDKERVSVKEELALEDSAVAITNEITSGTFSEHVDEELNVREMLQVKDDAFDKGTETPQDGSTLPSTPTTARIEERTNGVAVPERSGASASTPTTSHPGLHHCHAIRYITDIKTPDLETPRRRRNCLSVIRYENQVKERRIKTLKKHNKRLKVKVRNLKDILLKFQKENLLTDDKMTELLEILPTPLSEMVLRKLNAKKTPYTAELRKLALTLHYYSPRAYAYVRKVLCNVLPSTSILRKWCCSSNFEPGFSEEVLDSLKRQKQPVICNLVLDEMSIRQQVEYKHEKWYGFVNTGHDDPDHSSTPHATSAFVFLLVALNGNFKVPMGYFLINSLTGKERANLLRTALVLAEEHGVHIHSVTFDGHQVNFTMAKELGACFEETKKCKYGPYIIHPTTLEKIYCFPDPTHMMKNVRNAFGETVKYNKDGGLVSEKPITDSKGQKISWKYIVQLHQLQNEIRLHYGNKVSDRHIKYKDNIQNARLAIQVLSNSVADALTMLETENKMFEGNAATAKFCRMINQGLEILNVRSVYGNFIRHKHGLPLKEDTKDFLRESAIKVITYIKGLVQYGGTLILECSRKCAFVGFVACLENMFDLFEDLKKKYGFQFLLTYKIQQDHLENFFSAIRLQGGYNNNPSAYQFEHAIRRIVVHHEVTASENSNCRADNVPVLTVSSATPKSREKEDNVEALMEEQLQLNDTDDVILPKAVIEIITYIAGFVVRNHEYHQAMQYV